MSLIVTGAGGTLGRLVAEQLLAQTDPAEVVLVTRKPVELDDLAARGADVRFGDFDDPASLDAAFAGGRRLLLISTDAIGKRVAQHGAAIDAAVRAGVGHVAYTSIPNPDPATEIPVAADHGATEKLLRESGLAWTMLRNALYSEFRVSEAQQAAASGQLRTNLGDGRTAYVSRADCAAAAAAVLLGGDEHAAEAYDVTGPELLGAAELAERYAAAADGAPVEVVAVTDDELVAGLEAAGLPAPVAGLLAAFGRAVRVGDLDQPAGGAERLIGRPAVTLLDVLRLAAPEG